VTAAEGPCNRSTRARWSPARAVYGLVGASTLLSGCFLWTTRGEGDQMLADGRDHEERLAALEEEGRRDREQLAEQINRAKTKVDELEGVLEKATQVVTRNSADLGVTVEELRQQIWQLEGNLTELRTQIAQQQREIQEERAETSRRLLQISQKIGLDVELDPSEIPQNHDEHYAAAYRAYQTRDFSRARSLFRAFVERYTRDDQADNALYWIGKTYLEQDRPATALGEFRTILSQYADGDAIDETLLDMADAFYRVNACTDARTALETLIRSHATSPLLEQARRKLREVQRAPRGYCRG
jgi:TolA-binding protein